MFNLNGIIVIENQQTIGTRADHANVGSLAEQRSEFAFVTVKTSLPKTNSSRRGGDVTDIVYFQGPA